MKPCKTDPALFKFFYNDELKGLISTHVDDFFYCGETEFFTQVIKSLKQSFTIKSEAMSSFRYLGLNVVQNNDFSINMEQDTYIHSISEIKIDKSQKVDKESPLSSTELHELRSTIGRLNWIANNTCPDILFDLCCLSSTVKSATVKDLLFINKLVNKVKSNPAVLRFKKIDLDDAKFICYNDSSFGNLINGGSQGGFVIYLADNTGAAVPIMWSSHRLKRVVKSAMAASFITKWGRYYKVGHYYKVVHSSCVIQIS